MVKDDVQIVYQSFRFSFGELSGNGSRKEAASSVMTVPGVISELDDDQANSVSSDVPSSMN